MEFEFMSADTVLPPCMPLPAAMLRLPISSTAKVMYARLLNTTLTAGIEDSNGILFVRFPIMELAAALSRSPAHPQDKPDVLQFFQGTLHSDGAAGEGCR